LASKCLTDRSNIHVILMGTLSLSFLNRFMLYLDGPTSQLYIKWLKSQVLPNTGGLQCQSQLIAHGGVYRHLGGCILIAIVSGWQSLSARWHVATSKNRVQRTTSYYKEICSGTTDSE